MYRKRILQGILLVLLLTYNMTMNAAENNIYTEDKPNIVVSSDHREFTIQLKSNPTTGYSWFLREYDSNLLMPIKHSFQKPDNKLMGAPGFEIWTFRVKPAGLIVPHQTVIRFVYARPWQGADGSTQQVFRVTITGAPSISHQ